MKNKEECLCDKCPRRFVCFTQKKVFSDPAYQAMYEAYIEEGLEHKEAVKEVREFIETQKTVGAQQSKKPWKDYEDWDDKYKQPPVKPRIWPKWDALYGDNVKKLPVDEAKTALDEIKKFTKLGKND